MNVQVPIALALTLASACALNWGYLREHGAASRLPPLSLRRPLRSLRLLLGSRAWLAGFGLETLGFGLYVAALALAPLALVQAVAAGGIGVLALLVARVSGSGLERHERLGVAISVAGLALLAISLAGGSEDGGRGSWPLIALWLGASAGAAALAVTSGAAVLRGGAAFGIAAGVLFAAGDVATKAAVSGGDHLAIAPTISGFYAAGTIVLQMGFQRGSALTTAGIATLGTSAIPIAAAMTLFAEPLPDGALGVVRVLSFAAVVAGAVALSGRGARAVHPGKDGGAARSHPDGLDARLAGSFASPGDSRKGDEMDETVITRKGLARLTEELERLTTTGRRAIADRLRQAAAGEVNRAENADYQAAREEQALLERRIKLLEETLRVARPVDPEPGNGRVDPGERVRLHDLDSGERFEVELVGTLETDLSANRISVVSPLGKALVGLRRGQVAGVEAPRGRRRFRVVAVEPPAPEA